MALKDWKKVRGRDRWWKPYSSRAIQNVSIEKYESYEVWWSVNPLSAGSHIKKLKTFKTKSQALRHAKAYMRKH